MWLAFWAFLPSSPTKFVISLLFSPLVLPVFHLHVERPRYETTVPSPLRLTQLSSLQSKFKIQTNYKRMALNMKADISSSQGDCTR